MSFVSRSRSICLSLFLSFAPAFGYAQQSAAPAAPTPVATEGSIHLDAVVNDKAGKPISGLELKDFTLLDNNQPAKVLSFHAFDSLSGGSAEPVQAILVLDSANLDFSVIVREREEIDKFLRSNDGKLPIRVSIILASDAGLKAIVQPSIDGNAAAAQLDQADSELRSVTRTSGHIADYERLELSVRLLYSLVTPMKDRPGRKLLFWIGDGWPLLDSPGFTQSPKGEQQLFDEIVRVSTVLREGRFSLYSVSEGFSGPRTALYEGYLKPVKSSRQANPANLSVKVFAVQSGGQVMTPTNDFAKEFAKCLEDAAPYYTLTFDPPRSENRTSIMT